MSKSVDQWIRELKGLAGRLTRKVLVISVQIQHHVTGRANVRQVEICFQIFVVGKFNAFLHPYQQRSLMMMMMMTKWHIDNWIMRHVFTLENLGTEGSTALRGGWNPINRSLHFLDFSSLSILSIQLQILPRPIVVSPWHWIMHPVPPGTAATSDVRKHKWNIIATHIARCHVRNQLRWYMQR